MGNCSNGRKVKFLVEMRLEEAFVPKCFLREKLGSAATSGRRIASGLPGKLHFTSNLTTTADNNNKCRPYPCLHVRRPFRETQLVILGDVMKVCFAARRGSTGGTAVITPQTPVQFLFWVSQFAPVKYLCFPPFMLMKSFRGVREEITLRLPEKKRPVNKAL